MAKKKRVKQKGASSTSDSLPNLGDWLQEFDSMLLGAAAVSENKFWREEPADLLTFFTDMLGETLYEGKQTTLISVVNDVLWWKFTGKECSHHLKQVTEIIVLFGKGCKSGNSTLYDPITNKMHTFEGLYNSKEQIHVRSLNEITGKIEVCKASSVERTGYDVLYKISTPSRSTTVAGSHRFLDISGKWKQVYELEPSDLIAVDGGISPVYETIVCKENIGEDYFYDITVPDTGTYISDGFIDHNSGKDFLISAIVCYIVYLLCCINNPQRVFSFGKGEPIDVINLAENARQANRVFFVKLKARFNSCPWFEKVDYNPSDRKDSSPNMFQVTEREIRMYQNITAHSGHSDAESFEGFNPLVIIFDEIAAVDPDIAKHSYQIFRSSASSRYASKMLMLFISYPRSADDFMMQKYEEATQGNDPELFAIKGSTWEVNKSRKKEDFEKDYRDDPESAQCKYEVMPPKAYSGFFTFPENIDRCVVSGKTSQNGITIINPMEVVRYNEGSGKTKYIALELFNLTLDPQYTYYLGGDAALTNDSYVLVLMHGEPRVKDVVSPSGKITKMMYNRPVEDLILEWKPSKKNRISVDLLNVEEIIETLCKKVRIKKALFDKFNSGSVIQKLLMYGVDAQDNAFSQPFQLKIYQNLKGLIYNQGIDLLDYRTVYKDIGSKVLTPNQELAHLRLIDGKKIDHDPDKSKDISDARAAATWICSTDDVTKNVFTSPPTLIGVKRKTGNNDINIV